MKVRELITKLNELNLEADICIYENEIALPPNNVFVADNDDNVPTCYHLYYSEENAE